MSETVDITFTVTKRVHVSSLDYILKDMDEILIGVEKNIYRLLRDGGAYSVAINAEMTIGPSWRPLPETVKDLRHPPMAGKGE